MWTVMTQSFFVRSLRDWKLNVLINPVYLTNAITACTSNEIECCQFKCDSYISRNKTSASDTKICSYSKWKDSDSKVLPTSQLSEIENARHYVFGMIPTSVYFSTETGDSKGKERLVSLFNRAMSYFVPPRYVTMIIRYHSSVSWGWKLNSKSLRNDEDFGWPSEHWFLHGGNPNSHLL